MSVAKPCSYPSSSSWSHDTGLSQSSFSSCQYIPVHHPSTTATTTFTRSFYTWNIPKDTPRSKLDDGSTLIHRRHNLSPNVSTANTLDSAASSSLTFDESKLPPRLRSWPDRSILSKDQIMEARNLRNSNPDVWTVSKLAKRYNTFPAFILKIAPFPPERKRLLQSLEEDTFNKLSISKKVTMIDRLRRKHQ